MCGWTKVNSLSKPQFSFILKKSCYLWRIMQEYKQKCVRLVPNVEYKCILQLPKYLIFIVNRFNYIYINITKNRSIIPMNLLGPYRFNLQTTVGHHRHSMNCGHYTSIIVVENILCQRYWNYLNVYQWYPQLVYNIYIIWQDRGGWGLVASHGASTCVCPLNTGRGIGIESYGQYISSLRCPVWLGYWLYMIRTQMSNWDGLWWPALYGHRLSYTG